MNALFNMTEFLTEHENVTIALGAVPGEITVTVAGLGRATISDLSELPALLMNEEAFEAPNPRSSGGEGPNGYVLKADQETDLYAVWSSVVDNAVLVGDREVMLRRGVSPSRLARADLYGTSAQWPKPSVDDPNPGRYLGWDTAELLVREQSHAPSRSGGLLPRASLGAYMQALSWDDDAAAGALLLPLPEDPDDENED